MAQAIDNSTLAASFGTGSTRVEVRQVHPDGIDATNTADGKAASVRTQQGVQLASNPTIAADGPTKSLLTGGLVDSRAMAGLAALAAQQPVQLLAAPAVDGEDTAGTPRRQLLIRGGDTLQQFFASQTGPLAPSGVTTSGDNVLVTYSAVNPA